MNYSWVGWPTVLINLKVNPVIIGKVQDLADFPQKKIIYVWFFSENNPDDSGLSLQKYEMKRQYMKVHIIELATKHCARGLSEQFLECVLFIWNILICLTFYTIFTLANSFSQKKKKIVAHFAIIIPLWTIPGWVVLPCCAHLALTLEMAHATQNWVTLLPTGTVCPWLCAEFDFSSNWRLSCEQSWQDAVHGRRF